MKQKNTDPWADVPNLKIRGPRRVCYVRVEINGEELVRSLHIEADPLGRNKADVVDAIRAFKLRAAQDTFAILKLTRSRNEHSTFAEIFAAYRAACAGRDILEKTFEQNIGWLEHIVRVAQGEFVDVKTQRTSLLTVDLLTTFQERKITAIKTKADAEGWSTEQLEQRMKSGKNSAKSVIQQARSLFSVELLQSRHYRDLVLPDLSKFMAFRADGSSVAPFVRPAADVWQKIVADLPALKASSLAQWFALNLGVNCGLRRGSARAARWAWCTALDSGEAEMEVRRAKGGHYIVTLQADLWAELLAARASTDYIIPATIVAAPGAELSAAELEADRDATIDAVVAWLRARGLNNRTPFHTLRKIFGNAMVRTHGLTEGQNALGHSKQDLTHSTYSEHRSTRTVRAV